MNKTSTADIDCDVKDIIENMLVKHGLTDVPLTDVNKEKAIKDLLVAEVLITRTLALDAFFRGLNSLGLGNLLRKHPSIKEFVLPSLKQVAVDIEFLKSKLNEAMKEHTTVENSKNDGQIDIVAKEATWKWFMRFIDDAKTLEGKHPNAFK